jgi:flagellar protein FliS
MPNQLHRYQEVEIRTATPIHLVVLLYDAALANLQRAQEHIAAHDIASRTRCINKATSILTELQTGLEYEAGEEIARSLDRLYRYMKNRIFQANLNQSAAPLKECVQLLIGLRDAWGEVERIETHKIVPAGMGTYSKFEPLAAPLAAADPASDLNSKLNLTA